MPQESQGRLKYSCFKETCVAADEDQLFREEKKKKPLRFGG